MHKIFLKWKRYLIDIPLILYWLLILTLTSLPSDNLPSTGMTDKYEHFLAFFGLGFLLYLKCSYQSSKAFFTRYAILCSIVICSVYAAFDEMHQYFIPGRYMDFYDWLADTIGTFIGVVFIWGYLRLEKYLIERKH